VQGSVAKDDYVDHSPSQGTHTAPAAYPSRARVAHKPDASEFLLLVTRNRPADTAPSISSSSIITPNVINAYAVSAGDYGAARRCTLARVSADPCTVQSTVWPTVSCKQSGSFIATLRKTWQIQTRTSAGVGSLEHTIIPTH
jgi:hypothetical protein